MFWVTVAALERKDAAHLLVTLGGEVLATGHTVSGQMRSQESGPGCFTALCFLLQKSTSTCSESEVWSGENYCQLFWVPTIEVPDPGAKKCPEKMMLRALKVVVLAIFFLGVFGLFQG